MNEGDVVSEVTEADREKARRLLTHAYCRADECECSGDDEADAIAAALAEEREKARAPFLALAATFTEKSELARNGRNQWGKDTFEHGEAYAFRQAAGDVLNAAKETE